MTRLSTNKKKQYRRILDVYKEHKQSDVPDTFIVRVIFPRHHIYISYVQWMRIKGRKPSEIQEPQLSLF
jgi:hypothetical protein